MNCPNCSSKQGTQVIDTRPRLKYIRRRRECFGCGHRFTTYEMEKLDRLTVHQADPFNINIKLTQRD
jgi:transcriptional regulator NrdR family protein